MRDTLIAPLVALLVVASVVTPVVASSAQTSAYAGSNVTFDVEGSSIVDYSVQGTTMLDSVSIQSQSEAESDGGIAVDGDLAAVANVSGAGLTLESQAETRATVTAESGAEMRAHDNSRGILVVESGGESQYVLANVSSSSNAESEGDGRVTVTTEDGAQGTFVVVGGGNATVNDEGDVAAELDEDARLVFRAYDDGRDDDDRAQERMIANGTAAAEVHVMERDGETVADTAEYSSDTTVEVVEKSEGTVKMTAERAEHEGRVVITSVSGAVVDATEDVELTVDGEAAAEASSYSELRSAIGGDTSKFMVRQASSASASGDVLVAINGFSEREVAMTDGSSPDGGSGDGTDANDDDGDDPTESDSNGAITDGQPGFGALVALGAFAVLGALGALRRR